MTMLAAGCWAQVGAQPRGPLPKGRAASAVVRPRTTARMRRPHTAAAAAGRAGSLQQAAAAGGHEELELCSRELARHG